MRKTYDQQKRHQGLQRNYQASRPPLRFDARAILPVAAISMIVAGLMLSMADHANAAEPLAVINGGISASEDAPFVASDYKFLPGDYLYVTFQVANFSIQSEERGEVKKISLSYEVTVQDTQGRPLVAAISDAVDTSINAEDKNWVPKRRASFLLPSFLAAGAFQVQIAVKDRVAKTETSRAFPFLTGGTRIEPAASIAIQNFRFLRSETDSEPLALPAYSGGDTVFARFDLVGFQNADGNEHHVAYGVTVSGPDGKTFIKDPDAADLKEGGYYPAQFLPGDLALKMGKSNAHGQYLLILKARDLVANQEIEVKKTFSIE
jgi:hypothetical protein